MAKTKNVDTVNLTLPKLSFCRATWTHWLQVLKNEKHLVAYKLQCLQKAKITNEISTYVSFVIRRNLLSLT